MFAIISGGISRLDQTSAVKVISIKHFI